MINHIKELKNGYNYLSDIEGIYGRENDILFVASGLDRKNMICLTFSVERGAELVEKIEALREKYDAIPLGGVYMDGYTLNVELNLVNIDEAKDFTDIVDAVTAVIVRNRSQNISSDDGKTGDIGIFRIGTKMVILDGAGFEETTESMSEQYKKKSDSPLIPYIVAIGGMLLGVALWILIGRIGFISGIAGYFILSFAIKGFQKMGGQIYKKDVYILLGLALFMIFFAEFTSIALSIMNMGRITLIEAYQITWKFIVGDGGILREFLLNVAIGIGLSLWSSWGLVNNLLNFTPTSNKRVRRRNTRLL
ncbi:hypothetical protein G7062_01485 [Erysipelothrix sp. HDW6C]|uniref:hypothetical protein n=1 Tax=Erysipelothrix sp. HDW6C TaxID=2714930 RepID=UPI001409D5C3|nr:hypothetical protein [Erysipelothrix sp. HDW6C]QIK69033.1 hypothetical protein G7062_01485 [Erysipelothrix sp. HDW6C]